MIPSDMPAKHLPSSLRHGAVVLILAALVVPALPSAQAEDKAMAVSLFDEGKKLMEAGKYAEACPKLEASRKADPSADGVVLRLALCYQGLNKHATAWGLFKESLARAEKAKRNDRIEASKKGIAETEARMTRVSVVVAADGKIPGLVVQWDDKVLDEGVWGSPLPVDPGPHQLVAKAPGRKTFELTVQVGETAEKKTVTVPRLDLETAKPAPTTSSTAPTVASTTPSTTPPPSPPLPPTKEGPSYVAPLVVMGLGVAIVGVGGYFGLAAQSTFHDSSTECRSDNRCTPRGVDLRNDAIHRANLSTVFFVGGGVVLAAGATWAILKSRSTTAQVGLVPGGIMLAGTFQ